MPKVDSELRHYAVLGAEQELLKIAEQARTIFRAFPELRARGRGFAFSGDEGHLPSPFDGSRQSAAKPTRRRRRTMSAAARRKISQAQKRRWAKQRASKKS